MNWIIEDTIPANTLEANARITRRGLPKGIITKVHIEFPWGCAGLAHLQIFRGASQIWPSDPDQDYARDRTPLIFEPLYEIKDEPTRWHLRTWNLDDTFQHRVTVYFTIVPKIFVFPDLMLARVFQRVIRFFKPRVFDEGEFNNG